MIYRNAIVLIAFSTLAIPVFAATQSGLHPTATHIKVATMTEGQRIASLEARVAALETTVKQQQSTITMLSSAHDATLKNLVDLTSRFDGLKLAYDHHMHFYTLNGKTTQTSGPQF